MKLEPVHEGGDDKMNAEAEFKNVGEASGALFINPSSGVDVPMAGSQEYSTLAKVEGVKDDAEASAAEVASEWAEAKAEKDAAQSWMGEPVLDGWGDEGANTWGLPAGGDVVETTATWKEDVHSLTALLGPTSLPLTHKVGYVEESVRRIVSWSGPEPLPELRDLNIERNGLGTSDPMKKFARFVLAPLGTYSTAERAVIRAPELLKDPNSTKDKKATAAEQEGAANVPPHDPLKDNIVVLLDPRTVEHAIVGMAVGGTFVQLVPDAAQTSTSTKGGNAKKGKSKAPADDKPQTWWYAENIIQVLPSYWTESKE